MVEIDKAAEFRRLKKQRDGEEDPVIIAQRFLNIFRQLHIFNQEKKDAFNKMLLGLPPYVRGMFSTLPGGGVLQEYVDDLVESEGLESNDTLSDGSEDKDRAKILAAALAEANQSPTENKEETSNRPVGYAGPTVAGKIEMGAGFANEFAKALSQALKESNQNAKDEIRSMIQTLGQTQLEIVKVLHSENSERKQESERLTLMLTQAQGQIAEMLSHPHEFSGVNQVENNQLIKMLADSQAQIAETLSEMRENGGNNTNGAELFELSQQQFIKAVDAINENGKQNSKEIANAISESQQQLAKLIIQQNNQRMAAATKVEGDDIKINAADYLNQLNQIADKFSSVQGINDKTIEKTVENLVKAQLEVYREVASTQARELSSIISIALKESQEISTKNLLKALEKMPQPTVIEKTVTVPQPVFTPFFNQPTGYPLGMTPPGTQEQPQNLGQTEAQAPSQPQTQAQTPTQAQAPVQTVENPQAMVTPAANETAEEDLVADQPDETSVEDLSSENDDNLATDGVISDIADNLSAAESVETEETNLEGLLSAGEEDSNENDTLEELFNIGEEPDAKAEELIKPKKKKKKKKNKNKSQNILPTSTETTEAIISREEDLNLPDLSADPDGTNLTNGDNDPTDFISADNFDLPSGEDFDFNFENDSTTDQISSQQAETDNYVPLREDILTPSLSTENQVPFTEEDEPLFSAPEKTENSDTETDGWGFSSDNPVEVKTENPLEADQSGGWDWESDEAENVVGSNGEAGEIANADDGEEWEWEYEEVPEDEAESSEVQVAGEDEGWEWEYEEVPEGEEGQDWEWEYEEVPEDEDLSAAGAANANQSSPHPAGNW